MVVGKKETYCIQTAKVGGDEAQVACTKIYKNICSFVIIEVRNRVAQLSLVNQMSQGAPGYKNNLPVENNYTLVFDCNLLQDIFYGDLN